MIEFISNPHGVRVIQRACEEAEKLGVAKCIKNSKIGRFDLKRYLNGAELPNGTDLDNRNFGVIVYKEYVLRVGRGKMLTPHVSSIRLWFDERKKVAGFKISEEDLIALIQSNTVIGILNKLNIKLDGHITIQVLSDALNKALLQLAPEAEAGFKARKNK